MASSEVDIVNLALDRLGETNIVSLDDTNKAARLMKRNYPQVRDMLLRSYRWNFSIKRVVLAPDTTAPTFGFTHAFRKPADLLSFIGAYDDEQPVTNYTSSDISVKLEGEFILANENPLSIFYMSKVTDPTLFDAFFVDLVAIELATRLAYGFTTGNGRTINLSQERASIIKAARTADAFEGTPEVITSDNWINAHDGYGFSQGLRNRNAV